MFLANEKRINKARSLFDKMSEKNVVSWTQGPNHFTFSTSLVGMYAKCGDIGTALCTIRSINVCERVIGMVHVACIQVSNLAS